MTDSEDVPRPMDAPNDGLEKSLNIAQAMAERIKRIEELFSMQLPVGPDHRPIRNFLNRLYQAKDLLLKNESVPDDFFENPGCVSAGGVEYVVVEPGETVDVSAGDAYTDRTQSLLGVQSISNNHLLKQHAGDVVGNSDASERRVPGIGLGDGADNANDVAE